MTASIRLAPCFACPWRSPPAAAAIRVWQRRWPGPRRRRLGSVRRRLPVARPRRRQRRTGCRSTRGLRRTTQRPPGAKEICNNGIDDDCNGFVDGRTRLTTTASAVPGRLRRHQPAVHRRRGVINGLDDDCDGCGQDLDGTASPRRRRLHDHDPSASGRRRVCATARTMTATATRTATSGYGRRRLGPCSGDCDDTNIDVYPGRPSGQRHRRQLRQPGRRGHRRDGWTVANGDCNDNDRPSTRACPRTAQRQGRQLQRRHRHDCLTLRPRRGLALQRWLRVLRVDTDNGTS